METCKYGSGAGKRKPTAVKRKGVVCRAYEQIANKSVMPLKTHIKILHLTAKKKRFGKKILPFSTG